MLKGEACREHQHDYPGELQIGEISRGTRRPELAPLITGTMEKGITSIRRTAEKFIVKPIAAFVPRRAPQRHTAPIRSPAASHDIK